MTIMLLAGSACAGTQQQGQHRQNWFPPAPAAHPAAYVVSPTALLDQSTTAHEQAIAPIPPATATGLTALGALWLISARKALKRFLLD